MSDAPTASQTVGPFFSIGLAALCRENIACSAATGTPVTIHGRVLDGDGQPVPDAALEVWQASEAGLRGEEKSPNGFTRIATNECGEFKFTTVKPQARREEDGTVHAPHVSVVVFMRGLLRHLMTRIYFSGETANAEDLVLQLVPAHRRETLLATTASGVESELQWDIHLQGKRETVFFEV